MGGGEPLLSPNFAPVVRRARRRGLVPNVTTNGWLITEALLRDVEGSIGEVRMSLIWERSAVFDRIRRDLGRVEGHCGVGAHNPFCKGCRAVVQSRTGHWLAADEECGFAPCRASGPAAPEGPGHPLLLPMVEAGE